ncbi:MAG: helix-turn-helix domain-containing protein [Bacteroidota bacterium]
MNIDKKSIGERLKKFGKEHYGSVSKFADALKMSQPSLSGNYLNGKSIPGGEMLAKLLALGCDIDWLLTGEKSHSQLSVSVAGNKAKGSNNVQGNTGSVAMANPPVYIQTGEKSFDVSNFPENAVVINAAVSEALTSENELLKKEVEYLKQRIIDLEGLLKAKEELIQLLKK